MHTKTKYILIGTALLAATGSALAFNGRENCDQRGALMQGEQGMHMMKWHQKKHHDKGLNRDRKAKRSLMRSIYQLEDLTPEQRNQLDEIRNTQREIKRIQRVEMKQKVEAVLTEQQREVLGISLKSSL